MHWSVSVEANNAIPHHSTNCTLGSHACRNDQADGSCYGVNDGSRDDNGVKVRRQGVRRNLVIGVGMMIGMGVHMRIHEQCMAAAHLSFPLLTRQFKGRRDS